MKSQRAQCGAMHSSKQSNFEEDFEEKRKCFQNRTCSGSDSLALPNGLEARSISDFERPVAAERARAVIPSAVCERAALLQSLSRAMLSLQGCQRSNYPDQRVALSAKFNHLSKNKKRTHTPPFMIVSSLHAKAKRQPLKWLFFSVEASRTFRRRGLFV